MSDDNERDESPVNRESWLSNWEEECIQEWEDETNMDERLKNDSEISSQKLWMGFQNSATAVAQLYKGNILNKKLFFQLFHFQYLSE